MRAVVLVAAACSAGCGREAVAESGNWMFFCEVSAGAKPGQPGGEWTGQSLDDLGQRQGSARTEQELEGKRIPFVCRVTDPTKGAPPGASVVTGTVSRIDFAERKVWLKDCAFERWPRSRAVAR